MCVRVVKVNSVAYSIYIIMNNLRKISAKKSLGQHFLTSDIVPNWMCDAMVLKPDDTVLEIGPGTGVLTKEILSRGVKVIALETDIRAIEILKETFKSEIAEGNLTLHHTDVRKLDLSTIPNITHHSFKVISNIPYYLSGFLLRLFLESQIQPTDLVYLVQKEVAKRIVSSLDKGEKESILSLSVKVYGKARYVRTVSRGHFTPPPKVDSGIVAIRDINRVNFKTLDESLFFNVLHLGFRQKRKQLLGNLSKKYNREALTNFFELEEIPISTRAEDVPLEKWLVLVQFLSKI